MTESRVKADLSEVYEVVEQQKKLEEVNDLINKALENVNQAINSIAVENLQLTQLDLDDEIIEEEQLIIKEEQQATFKVENSSIINQQIINIDVPAYNYEELESDEDLDQL